MKLFLSKEEKFHAESIATKRRVLLQQDQLLQSLMDDAVADILKRNSVDTTIVGDVNLNIEKGFIEFGDPEKKIDPEKKPDPGKKSKK